MALPRRGNRRGNRKPRSGECIPGVVARDVIEHEPGTFEPGENIARLAMGPSDLRCEGRLTVRGTGDPLTAVTRALAEYLSQMEVPAGPGGRPMGFTPECVSYSHALASKPATLPAINVHVDGVEARFSDPMRYPALEPENALEETEHAFLFVAPTAHVMVEPVTVAIWCEADKESRPAITSAVVNAIYPPGHWEHGITLIAPHYHGAAIEYTPRTIVFSELDSDVLRGFLRADITLAAQAPAMNVLALPKLKPMVSVAVTEPPC